MIQPSPATADGQGTGGQRLPEIPTLPDSLLAEHAEAQAALAARLHAASPASVLVFRYLQRRLTLEALANVGPTRPNAQRPALFPERRRFLTVSMEARMRGCSVAFRHLDARVAMFKIGHVETIVGTETPAVLNALAESGDPDQRETNPGLPRATDSGFDETNSGFVPALPAECERLMVEAATRVNRDDSPLIARAGWLATVTFAVHPFVDGNGRTARLLFSLVNSAGAESGTDWGSMEQWASNRDRYIETLRMCTDPSIPAYHADRVETLPFMSYACELSTKGALLAIRRLDELDGMLETFANAGPTDEHAIVAAAVLIDRNAALDELALLVDEPRLTDVVNDLVRAQVVAVDHRGLIQPRPHA